MPCAGTCDETTLSDIQSLLEAVLRRPTNYTDLRVDRLPGDVRPWANVVATPGGICTGGEGI